jgi:hypothetical protein
MALVDIVLDKVRQSDLQQFKTKVEEMEEKHVQYLEEQGLFNMDMLVEDKIEHVKDLYVDGEEATAEARKDKFINPKKEDQRPSGEEMFTKFIQAIKG